MTNFEQQVNLFHGIFVYCGIAALLLLAVAVALFFLLKIPQVFSEITGRGAKKAIEEMEGEGAISRRIGEDGRKKRKGLTGALGTGKLRRNTGNLRRSVSSPTGLMTGQETEAVGQQTAQTFTESMETGKMSPEMNSLQPENNASGLQGQTAAQGVPDSTYQEQQASADTLRQRQEAAEESVTDTLPKNDMRAKATVSDATRFYRTGEAFDMGEAPTDVLNKRPDTADGSSATTVLGKEGETAAYQPPMQDTMVLNVGMKMPATEFHILRTIMEVHTDEVIE